MSAAGRPVALDVPPGVEGGRRAHAAMRDALRGAGPAVVLLPVSDGTDHVERQRAALAADEAADGVAAILTTSGSSGDPVGVLLPASALLSAARATHSSLPLGPGRWVVATPVTSVGGLMGVVRSIDAGLDPVIWSGIGGAESFTPESFRACLDAALTLSAADGAPAYAALVPTQLARVLRDPSATSTLARLDHVLIGAAALPAAVRAAAESAGIRLTSSYGASETCGGVVYDGRPLDGVLVEVDADGHVRVGGTTIAAGYHRRPDLTERAFHDGWYRSQDIGELSDGVLRVLGRADDVIKVGGTKVSLLAIVDAARGVPGVSDAAAVAVEDDEWGQRPVLAVVGEVNRDAVLDAVRSVAGPTRSAVHRLDSLPYLPNGKIDRMALRAAITASDAP